MTTRTRRVTKCDLHQTIERLQRALRKEADNLEELSRLEAEIQRLARKRSDLFELGNYERRHMHGIVAEVEAFIAKK